MTQKATFTVDALSKGAQRALYNLITILGDNKFRLGMRYADFCNAAPTLEAGIAAAAMAQDELGHTRNLFPLLREFSWAKDEVEDGLLRPVCRCLSLLDAPFAKWADFVVAGFLLDQALTVILASAQASAFVGLRQRARKMVAEERYHTLYATGWFKSLAQADGQLRDELIQQTQATQAEVLCFFGPAGNQGLQILQDEGLLDANSETLRARFVERIAPTLQAAQLSLDADALPWERWDWQAWRLKA